MPMLGRSLFVGPQPFGGNLLDLVDAFENVAVEPLMPDRPVIALYVGVLLGFSGLDVGQTDPPVLCPFHEGATDVFRAVVDSNFPWGTTPFDDLVQGSDDPLCGQREIDLDIGA